MFIRYLGNLPRSLTGLLFIWALFVGPVQASDPKTRDINQILNSASYEPIWVHLDGCPLDFEIPPVIVENRTFVEVNTLFKALGLFLHWDGANQKVIGTSPYGRTFELQLGSRIAKVGQQSYTLPAAPFLAVPNNRVMVPLNFINNASEDTKVLWRQNPRTVDIHTQEARLCKIDNAARMSEIVWRGYNDFNQTGPITIVKGQHLSDQGLNTTYLVAMSGTDLDRVEFSGAATGIFEDFLLGFFNENNAYVDAVVDAMLQGVPQNARVILAGHSLGGMVAQAIAANSFIKQNYQIVNVVATGAPLLNALQREGEVVRLGDSADMVPALSAQGVRLPLWQLAGLNREDGGYGLNIFKAHTESYRRPDLWGNYDATGHKGGRDEFVFNTKNLLSYIALREIDGRTAPLDSECTIYGCKRNGKKIQPVTLVGTNQPVTLPSNAPNINEENLRHAVEGDFNLTGRMTGGGHGQTNLDILARNGISYNINHTFDNGVRVGTVYNHDDKEKRLGVGTSGQSWFPSHWTAEHIAYVGQWVYNRKAVPGQPGPFFDEIWNTHVGIFVDPQTNLITTIFPHNFVQPAVQ